MVVDGYRQAQLGWFVEPYMFKDLRPGTEDIFDNSFMSAEVLRSFYRAHSDELAKIAIKNPEVIVPKYMPNVEAMREKWDRTKLIASEGSGFIEIRRLIEGDDNFEQEDDRDRDILKDFDLFEFEVKTLKDLILLGLIVRDFAGAISMDLIDQLKALKTHWVLFAVDGYNVWESPSAYQYEYKVVKPKQMCIPYMLNFLAPHKAEMSGWKHTNGIAIGACTFKHPEGTDIYEDKFKSFHTVIKMPSYSSIEYLSAMRKYLETSAYIDEFATTQELIAFRMFCASNPRLVRTESAAYFLPLSSLKRELTQDIFDLNDTNYTPEGIDLGGAETAGDENDDDEDIDPKIAEEELDEDPYK